ncbi:DUF305 domain-containing protein [Kitasatospora sp. NPDC051853]|uniref:DUF305 domain-containing protein n=1 Tax=Kitasatospora sp. NPDC051853 TaxID=3364058 RepID=UPI0037887D47
MNSKLIRRTSLATAALLAGGLLLTACGSGGSGSEHSGGHSGASASATVSAVASAPASGTASAKPYNATDLAFVQGMIPHHRQALEMAELAGTRASAPEVKQLAEQIRKAQDPEIATMSGWLTAWGEQVPQAGGGHSGHGAGASGMMSEAEMASLKDATGAAFDKAFLKLMVAHHTGAVTMAEEERAKGAFGPAKELAGAVISGQSAEIATMNGLLAKG